MLPKLQFNRVIPLGVIVVILAMGGGVLKTYPAADSGSAAVASYLASSGDWDSDLRTIVTHAEEVRDTIIAAATGTNETEAVRAAQLLCIIGDGQDMERLLPKISKIQNRVRRALFAKTIGSGLAEPYSQEGWKHIESCLTLRYGDLVFYDVLDSVTARGGRGTADRLVALLSRVDENNAVPPSKKRAIEDAIAITSQFEKAGDDDFPTALNTLLRKLASLHQVKQSVPTSVQQFDSQRRIAYFSIGSFLYLATFHKSGARWVPVSVWRYAVS